jgi:hypothetical protein
MRSIGLMATVILGTLACVGAGGALLAYAAREGRRLEDGRAAAEAATDVGVES